MCITFLASEYNNIDLYIEHIMLTLGEDGKLALNLIIDVFLTPTKDWKNAKITCISPHNLLRGKELSIRTISTPGVGTNDDIFYNDVRLYEVNYSAGKKIFSVSLPASFHSPSTRLTLHGNVISPKAYLPNLVLRNNLAIELMEECGTIFELDLGDLKGGLTYAFRLVMQPSDVLGLPEVRSQDIREVDGILSNWVQDAVITCPRTCRYNYHAMVDKAKNQFPEYKEAVAIIQTVAQDARLKFMPIKRGQIVLILPKGAELIGNNPVGNIWKVSTYTLSDGRPAAVWATGADEYWIDDPELVARRIYQYINAWGVAQPKSKEEVSTATDAGHENCSMIIDEMCAIGILIHVGNGRYTVGSKSGLELEQCFRNVAASEKVAEKFRWLGSQINYSVQYRYINADDRILLSNQEKKRKIVFWIAIIALSIGLINLTLRLVEYFR